MEFIRVGNILTKYVGNSRDVIIPDGIEIIDEDAFYDNYYITNVIMPHSVRIIEDSAFRNCEGLSSVVFSKSLTFIGKKAFNNCKSLKSIELPESLRFVDSEAFQGCGKLGKIICHSTQVRFGYSPVNTYMPNATQQKLYDKDGYLHIGGTLLDYNGSSKDIVIPASVKRINADCSFYNDIKSVSMDSSVEIFTQTFSWCKNLADKDGFIVINDTLCGYVGGKTEITLPEGIKKISFLRSASVPITSVVIPEGVETIYPKAFQYSSKLKKVVLPKSLKTIGENAFYHCSALEEINLPDGVDVGDCAFEGCDGLADKDGFLIVGNTLVDYYGESTAVSVPEGIVKIERFHAKKDNIEKIFLPQGLKEIGKNAFWGCSKLTEITIPESVETIGSGAFGNCPLEKIIIPDNVKRIGASAFYGCSQLKEVKLSNSIKRIENGTFYGCESLSEITIPQNVEFIDRNSFVRCEGINVENENCIIHYDAISSNDIKQTTSINSVLFRYYGDEEKVVLPQGIKIIGPQAFFEGNIKYENRKAVKSVSLPEGVLRIEAKAFIYCHSLEEIYIPASVEYIGLDAFSNCSNLKNINISPDNQNFVFVDGILFNKNQDQIIFATKNIATPEYRVPDTVKSIAHHAFSECDNLTGIFVPKEVEYIGDRAFIAKNLKDIEIEMGAGSKYVGSYLFRFTLDKSSYCFPKLPLDIINGIDLKNKLAVGYCLNPEKYEGEYAEHYKAYVIAHKNQLIKFAREYDFLRKVIEFYENIDKEKPKSKEDLAEKFKKMSDLQRVLSLEDAVLKNDIEAVNEVIEGCKAHHKKPFEFTARALCLACEFGSLEMVKLLVKNKATFKFKYTPILMGKYGCGHTTVSGTTPAEYYLILADDGRHRNEGYRFGILQKSSLPANSVEARAEILDYLLSENISCGLNLPDILYCSINWGNQTIADYLMNHNVELANSHRKDLMSNRSGWFYSFIYASAENCSYALESFSKLLKDGEAMIITDYAFREQDSTFYHPNVLKLVFEKCNTEKISTNKVLKGAVERDNSEALAILANLGFIKTPKFRDELIKQATTNKKHEALAWLLEYKNRTADFAAEAEAEEKKMMRELNENPNSVTAMKRIWSYKKLEDGTLEITSYKGTDTEIVIPEYIGKSKVTRIGATAFSAGDLYNKNIKNMNTRLNIIEVTIPKSVDFIDNFAFSDCEKLSKVIVENPNTNFGISVFSDCNSLVDENGMVIIHNKLLFIIPSLVIHIPDGVVSIENGALDLYNNIVTEIHIPSSVTDIKSSAFRGYSSRATQIFYSED